MEENEKNLNETTVDINDVSTVDTNQDDVELGCDLLCGASIGIDVDAMDWDNVFNHIPEIEQNILTIKSMIVDLTRMPYPDGTSDEEIVRQNNRTLAADNAFLTAEDFMKSVGVTDLSYEARPGITSYEKALLICMDAIIIQETVINYARCHALSNVNMDSMIDSMMSDEVTLTADQLKDLVASMNPIGGGDPSPFNDDDDDIQFPSDENGEEVL